MVEVGDAVTLVEPGARVSVYHAPSGGHCEACSRGEFFNCTVIGSGQRLTQTTVHGSDADCLLVDQNVYFPLPDELSYEDDATIACAGGTAYHETSGNDAARVAVIGANSYHGRIVYVGWGGTAKNATWGRCSASAV